MKFQKQVFMCAYVCIYVCVGVYIGLEGENEEFDFRNVGFDEVMGNK